MTLEFTYIGEREQRYSIYMILCIKISRTIVRATLPATFTA